MTHDNATDIVERLNNELGWGIGPAMLCQEAAQVITTLRKQLENARSEALEEAATLADEWRAENKQSALDAKKQGNHQFSAELETAATECNALQAAIRKLKGKPDNKPSGIPVDSPTSIQHDKSGYTP